MASLQRRQRTRVPENASARDRAKAPRPMPLEPIQLRPIQTAPFAMGFLGLVSPSVQADARLAIAREEFELRRLQVERLGLYQVQSNGDRVWVNGPDGASVARISQHGGIDVHRPLAEQGELGECLDCRRDLAGADAWEHFIRSLLRHFGVHIAERHRPKWATLDAKEAVR